MISANKIAMCKQKRFYSLIELGITVDATTEQLESIETANAVQAEHGTNSGIGSMELAQGEKIRGLLHLPTWLDRNQNTRVYVVFSMPSTTAADDVDFTLLYEAISLDGTVACVATINDALDTVIPATTKGSTTADVMQKAGPGVINGGTLDDDIEFLHVDLAATVADDVVDLFGIMLEYSPKWYKGYHKASCDWAN